MRLSPPPTQKFFGNDGKPLVGGLLFTYASGTSDKLATYKDRDGGEENTNPIELDYRGECRIWLDPSLTYTYVLSPPGDTDPPTNPIWSENGISAPNPGGGGGGGVQSIVAGTGISVDATDPANPIVSAPGAAPKHAFVFFGSDQTLLGWTNVVEVVKFEDTGIYAVLFTPGYFTRYPIVTATATYTGTPAPPQYSVKIGSRGFDFVELHTFDQDGVPADLLGGCHVHAFEPEHWIPPG